MPLDCTKANGGSVFKELFWHLPQAQSLMFPKNSSWANFPGESSSPLRGQGSAEGTSETPWEVMRVMTAGLPRSQGAECLVLY